MPSDDLDFDALRQDNDRYFDTMARYRESRTTLIIRSALSLLALGFGAFLMVSRFSDVSYLLFAPDAPVALGDVRSDSFSADTLKQLKTNDFVSFENDIIQFDEVRSSDGTYSFYYSPLTRFVVRTAQKLPAKDKEAIPELGQRELNWIMQRMVFPEDLTVSLSGQGRLIAAADAPDWARSVMDFMSKSSGDPVDSMFLMLEGDKPDSYKVYGFLFLVAVVLVLLTILFWGNSVRKFLLVKHDFESISSKGINLDA